MNRKSVRLKCALLIGALIAALLLSSCIEENSETLDIFEPGMENLFDAGQRVIDAVRPRVVIPMHYRLGGMGFPVIAELSDFTALCGNVVEYDTNALELTADTPAQTAVLRYCHE